MKKLHFFLALVFVLLLTPNLFTQEDEDPPETGVEIYVYNDNSGRDLYVRFYPISSVFNGRTPSTLIYLNLKDV